MRLIGSMHLLPSGSPDLPEWVVNAYEWCEELVFESDPSTIIDHLCPTIGVSLKKHLTPATWATLQTLWPESTNFPPIESVQPWAVSLFGTTFSSSLSAGVENLFLQWAAEQSKQVYFLESAEELVSTLDRAPIDDVVQSLELLAADLSAPQRSIEAMYQAWITMDLAAMHDIAMQSPMFQNPKLRQIILEGRNLAWVSMLLNKMASPKRTLVAVGALHLCGPGNLLTLLGRDAQHVYQK